MIPDVVLKMARRTQLVIQQADADELGLKRNTTAGEVQDAMLANEDKLAEVAAEDEDLTNEDKLAEVASVEPKAANEDKLAEVASVEPKAANEDKLADVANMENLATVDTMDNVDPYTEL